MLEVVLNQHRTLLKNVEDETNNCPIIEGKKVIAQPIQSPPNPENALKLAEARREQRKEKLVAIAFFRRLTKSVQDPKL